MHDGQGTGRLIEVVARLSGCAPHSVQVRQRTPRNVTLNQGRDYSLRGRFEDLDTRPGARSVEETNGWCARTVTGGRVEFAQYPSRGFDANQLCP